MSGIGSPGVALIAWTHFQAPDGVAWTTDADGGQALAEFAGRACYQTWDKPRPATATNAGFLRHIIEVGHLSVIEHATASFYLTGLSQPLAHELIRHRHFSFSELSPRYAPDTAGEPVMAEPEAIAADPELHKTFVAATAASLAAYHDLVAGLEERAGRQERAAGAGRSGSRLRQARQAALAVLPRATPTALVMTGNFRAWRHFIAVRGTDHADAGIRAVAIACLRHLRALAPHIFDDFAVTILDDGTQIAASPFAAEG